MTRTLLAATFLAAVLYGLNWYAGRAVWAWVVLMTLLAGGGE